MARIKPDSAITAGLLAAAGDLRDQLQDLRFAPPVEYVYNPLVYAWPAFASYLKQYAATRKRILFLGMNPGPYGMVQTGVPFGEVEAVRSWLKVSGEIARPVNFHPKRPVLGFACPRSEVSGRRLWGLFAERFGDATNFAVEHFVLNYCPLAFVEASGRNRTPDKLAREERDRIYEICDRHLRQATRILQPEWVIGVGDFAAARAQEVLSGSRVKIGKILHPSPASPAANRDWKGLATAQLEKLGVW